jgi:hypothetical protein
MPGSLTRSTGGLLGPFGAVVWGGRVRIAKPNSKKKMVIKGKKRAVT